MLSTYNSDIINYSPLTYNLTEIYSWPCCKKLEFCKTKREWLCMVGRSSAFSWQQQLQSITSMAGKQKFLFHFFYVEKGGKHAVLALIPILGYRVAGRGTGVTSHNSPSSQHFFVCHLYSSSLYIHYQIIITCQDTKRKFSQVKKRQVSILFLAKYLIMKNSYFIHI